MDWGSAYEVYAIRCSKSPLIYIGLTSRGLKARWSGHLSAMRSGGKGPLYDLMRRHGSESFSIETLLSDLGGKTGSRAEIDAIAALNTIWPNGLNLPLAAGGHHPSIYDGLDNPPLSTPLTKAMKRVGDHAAALLSVCG